MDKNLRDAIELVLEYIKWMDTVNSEEWVESAREAADDLEALMGEVNE